MARWSKPRIVNPHPVMVKNWVVIGSEAFVYVESFDRAEQAGDFIREQDEPQYLEVLTKEEYAFQYNND